jgi:pimeloyl-ACP methyl ester carboxylesterase
MHDSRALSIATDDDVLLAGDDAGEGPAAVLLHGLTATRRYVLMGSRALERSGVRVIAYDARGHGHSTPAPDPRSYGYERLAEDLEQVLDAAGLQVAALAGASMGAHTIIRFALEHPDRVSALALITPAFDPDAPLDPEALARWDALSRGLREGGVEGFISAYDLGSLPDGWRDTIEQVLRQRLSAHGHPDAVADALHVVPRSRPFEQIDDLAQIEVPTVVIASRDEADPGHPLALGERYAETIPAARLIVEEEGRSPLAWQGGQLSKVLAELVSRAG